MGVLGGDHSVALGSIQAINDEYDDFGILQIDAHADLKKNYFGFEQSRNSIMRNVLNTCPNMSKLIQIGVRELSEEEFNFSKEESRISTATIDEKELLNGKTFNVKNIIRKMPNNIYVSFDIDGLKP